MGDSAPVTRFSPNPGLWIDRTGNATNITGSMEMSGPEATSARTLSVQTNINTVWTATFTDGYLVSCRVSVRYLVAGTSSSGVTQIVAEAIAGPSNVDGSPRVMTLNSNERDAFTWTAAHEFGHILGLQDRYSEGVISRIRGRFGGARTNTIEPGYNGNLMAQDRGTLSRQNLSDLREETPAGWMEDDDRVRAWVNAHPVSDIRALSTANKLTMIRTLMNGWVSDDDMAVIRKICESVTDRAQSQAIQRGIQLNDFSSLGQRTQMRVIFSRMP